MKSRKEITKPQFKNSLKILAGIKGGKVTIDQRRSLMRVIDYVAKFYNNTEDDGIFFVSTIDNINCQYNMAGNHNKIVQLFTDLILRDMDIASILIDSIDYAHELATEAIKDPKIKKMFK